MTTFWDHLKANDKEELIKKFPNMQIPGGYRLDVEIKGKIKGLEDIDKDMRRVPRDTRRARERD